MKNFYSKKEIEFLKKYYPNKGKRWCAKKLNRSVGTIRSKVSKLGLKQNQNSAFFVHWQKKATRGKIGKKRQSQSIFMVEHWKKHPQIWTEERRKKLSVSMVNSMKRREHPRGMLGKKHTEEIKKILSKSSKKMWKNPDCRLNSKEYRNLLSNRMSKHMAERIRTKGSIYTRTHAGWYDIVGRLFFFRSSWEKNYARYLEWLVSKKEIESWEYEPKVFWFEKIKRGVRSYTPDFKIFNNDGTKEFHEVKGWMDSRSKTKIKRMAIYYPETKLIIIDKPIYKSIVQYERLFPEAKSVDGGEVQVKIMI